MVIKGFPSKTSKVTEFLRKEISTGNLAPGTRVMPIRSLAEQFSVCRKVVEVAFNILEEEKLITRKPNQGIYVSDHKKNRQSTIALFTETTGHVYEKQTNRMVAGFQENKYLTFVIDILEFCRNKEHQKEIFSDLLDRKLDGMVIDGLSGFPIELLMQNMDKLPKLAFFNRFEHKHHFDSLYVLSNCYHGISEATRYLQRNHKKVMFLTHDMSNFINHPEYPLGDHAKTTSAYRDVIKELNTTELIFLLNDNNKRELEELLRSPERPDAILAYSDFRAKIILDICNKIGLKIPEDIAVMGYFNTPWTEMLNVPLSSVSIQEEMIAETIVAKMTESRWTPAKIYIQPKLVIRESTERI